MMRETIKKIFSGLKTVFSYICIVFGFCVVHEIGHAIAGFLCGFACSRICFDFNTICFQCFVAFNYSNKNDVVFTIIFGSLFSILFSLFFFACSKNIWYKVACWSFAMGESISWIMLSIVPIYSDAFLLVELGIEREVLFFFSLIACILIVFVFVIFLYKLDFETNRES